MKRTPQPIRETLVAQNSMILIHRFEKSVKGLGFIGGTLSKLGNFYGTLSDKGVWGGDRGSAPQLFGLLQNSGKIYGNAKILVKISKIQAKICVHPNPHSSIRILWKAFYVGRKMFGLKFPLIGKKSWHEVYFRWPEPGRALSLAGIGCWLPPSEASNRKTDSINLERKQMEE